MEEREKNPISVSFAVYESERARDERRGIWHWILHIILILLLFGSNAAWLAYESQFTDEITETVETSTEGGGNAYGAVVSGSNNEVHYGESQGDTN